MSTESSQVKKKNQNINPDKEMEKNSMQKLDVIKERDRQLEGERPTPYARHSTKF
ncbi:MAG: hypothetical protein RSD97_05620 [Lachnospiraceae bacterium]